MTYSINQDICIHCGACMDLCDQKAVIMSRDHKEYMSDPEIFTIDKNKCNDCGDCVDACIKEAITKI